MIITEGNQRCCNMQNSNSQHLNTQTHTNTHAVHPSTRDCRCFDFVLRVASRMCRFEDGKPLTAPSRLTHIL
jgi:hypothetical protein